MPRWTVWNTSLELNELPLRSPTGRSQVREKLFLTEGGGSKVIVRGQFVLRDVSGVGSMRLPSLRSDGPEVARRWVAATVDTRLTYEPSVLGQVEKIGSSEFIDIWGGEVDLPTVAFRLDGNDASFGLTTRPKPVQASAEWEMDVRYGLKETHYEYRATVDTPRGISFLSSSGDSPRRLRSTR